MLFVDDIIKKAIHGCHFRVWEVVMDVFQTK